jgi:hypothetical protein
MGLCRHETREQGRARVLDHAESMRFFIMRSVMSTAGRYPRAKLKGDS